MHDFAVALAQRQVTLRSGAAPGADSAFENGCNFVHGPCEIYLPWEGFQDRSEREPDCLVTGECVEARRIASEIHPAWGACSDAAKALHTRNVYQILGPYLETPSLFVITWTLGGKPVGGTRTAILLAQVRGVPVFNLASREWALEEVVGAVLARRARARRRKT